MTFPEGKGYTSGEPITASVYATGIVSPMDIPNKDKVDFWVKLLKADPTIEDLKTELKGNIQTDNVIALVNKIGWDGACNNIKEEGTKHKGRWEKITNERYGISKAETWKPEGFILGKEKSQFEEALKQSEIEYKQCIEIKALIENEKKQQEQQVGKLDEYKNELEKINQYLTDLQKEIDRVQFIVNQETAGQGHLCPYCLKQLIYKDGKLHKSEITPPIMENQPNYEQYKENLASLKNDLKAKEQKRIELEWNIKECNKSIPAFGKKGRPVKYMTLEEAENNLKTARKLLQDYDNYHDAMKEHSEVLWRSDVVKILLPEGLRKQKTDKAVSDFNITLEELSKIACWGKVQIDTDFNPNYDDRIYEILSESEQYRVKATLQMAIAKGDNSQLVIFDRADLLTKKGRYGLHLLCQHFQGHSIILLSANEKNQIPQLNSETEMSYWIENGVLI